MGSFTEGDLRIYCGICRQPCVPAQLCAKIGAVEKPLLDGAAKQGSGDMGKYNASMEQLGRAGLALTAGPALLVLAAACAGEESTGDTERAAPAPSPTVEVDTS